MAVGPKMLSLRQLITEIAQELLAPDDARLIFHALRFAPVHHAEDATTLRRFGDNDLSGIGRSTEDTADLWHLFDSVEHIDWVKTFGEKDEKAVPCRHCQRVLRCQGDHRLVIPTPTHQARSRRFAKR